MNKVEFGIYFKKMREKNNLTLKNVADCLFVSIQSVNKYEKGISYPDTYVLKDLALLFNVDLDSLISLKDENNNNYCSTYNFDINKFSSNFNYLRKINNLSLSQLSSKLNVQYQTISKWEKQESLPNIEQLKMCSEIFNVTPSSIYFAINKEEKIEKKKRKNLIPFFINIGVLTNIISAFIITISVLGASGIIISNIYNKNNNVTNIDNSFISKTDEEENKIVRPFNVNASIAVNFFSLDDSIDEQEKSITIIEGEYYTSRAIEYVYNGEPFSVLASEKGEIIDIYYDKNYGNMLEIQGISGYKYIYGSLGIITPNIGDTVNAGQIIANAGKNIVHENLGNHLHFSVLNINNNSFIDPEDHFNNNKGN